jgi:hypothetical protein
MKGTGVENDERDFAEAWRAFEEEDAVVSAPASVQAAVMAAWHTRGHHGTGDPHRSRRVELVAVAAGILIAIGGIALLQRERPPRDAAPSPNARAATLPADALPPAPAIVAQLPVVPAPIGESTAHTPEPTREREASIVDSEPLQLVRVRMPREALAAFGMSLVEPEATSLVDVELLVADDGMPRRIRNVTAVFNAVERK